MTRAYTLIEIIFVIAIILIMVAIGIGSYGAARQSMAVDLQTDELVALLHQLRDTSRSQTKCVGVRFVKNMPPKKIETAYLNPRQGCDAKELLSELAWSDEVVVLNSLSILFVPPHGAMKTGPTNEKAEVEIAFKKNQAKSRKVIFEPRTGKIEKF